MVDSLVLDKFDIVVDKDTFTLLQEAWQRYLDDWVKQVVRKESFRGDDCHTAWEDTVFRLLGPDTSVEWVDRDDDWQDCLINNIWLFPFHKDPCEVGWNGRQ